MQRLLTTIFLHVLLIAFAIYGVTKLVPLIADSVGEKMETKIGKVTL